MMLSVCEEAAVGTVCLNCGHTGTYSHILSAFLACFIKRCIQSLESRQREMDKWRHRRENVGVDADVTARGNSEGDY